MESNIEGLKKAHSSKVELDQSSNNSHKIDCLKKIKLLKDYESKIENNSGLIPTLFGNEDDLDKETFLIKLSSN